METRHPVGGAGIGLDAYSEIFGRSGPSAAMTSAMPSSAATYTACTTQASLIMRIIAAADGSVTTGSSRGCATGTRNRVQVRIPDGATDRRCHSARKFITS